MRRISSVCNLHLKCTSLIVSHLLLNVITFFYLLLCSVQMQCESRHKIDKRKLLPIKSSLFDKLILCSLLQMTNDSNAIVEKVTR